MDDGLLPLFPLELVLLPDAPLALHIFEPRYREMIGECLKEKREFGIVRAHPGRKAKGVLQNLEGTGCTAEIVDVLKHYPDGRMDIVVIGKRRFQINAINEERSFYRADATFFNDTEPEQPQDAELCKSMLELHAEMLLLIDTEVTRVDEQSKVLSFQLLAGLPVDLDFKQRLLEMRSEDERRRLLLDYYTKVLPQLKTLAFGQKLTSSNGWVN